MSEARLDRLFHIFDEARQLEAAERTAFISRSCGTDDALRAEAMALLDADAASGAFMAHPAFERLAQAMALEQGNLQAGRIIGPYTVVQLLGTGGAGEVWRARDDRLGRDVAIKMLLPHAAGDPDRLRRFAEEARAASALNHSNILTVYDVGEHAGIPYLVSECLEGRSLRQRLDEGPMAVEDALAIGLSVARGLAAAHARGIVHRDLKPENLFLRLDGGVKILDFGLAKLQLSLGGAPADTRHTLSGVILGTAGYMAPEQAKGEAVDARADLFALGVMLYEMTAGQHPFRKGSTFETLHAVVTASPPDLVSLNAEVPPALGRIVMRLLQKDPLARFQSTPDVVWALEQVDPAAVPSPPIRTPAATIRPARRWRALDAAWASALAVLAVVGLVAFWLLQRAPSREEPTPALTRFPWPLPSGLDLGSAPVVSSDGRTIAFVGRSATGSQLYVHGLGDLEAVPIPGTDEAVHPFWSPDGTWLGFFAKGHLMKIAVKGGAPVALATALFPFGGTANQAGTIVFAPDVVMSGLFRVGAGSQTAEPATVLDPSLGDTSHCWPAFLPDGVHFLYFVRSARDERRGLYLGRIDRPAERPGPPLLRTDSNAVYVPVPGTSQGLLLSVINGRIEARRFDETHLTLTGEARTIGVTAAGTTLNQPVMVSASSDVLVFATSTVPYEFRHRLEAVDRSGQRLRVWNLQAQNWPSLSPDGRYLVRGRVDDLRNTPDIWVDDLERGSSAPVTTAVEPDLHPVWSPDGRRLAYVTGTLPMRPGKRVLRIAAADGTGVLGELPCPGDYCEPTDWTSSGLLANVLTGQRVDVWMVPTEGTTPAHPLLAEALERRDARMSRDGRWVAYVSWESGRPEVSVQSVVGPPRRIPVSSDGGDQPVWRRDNAELFFVDPQEQMQSVTVQWTRDGSPRFGRPVAMKNVPLIGRGHWGNSYDVSADGNRIYFLRNNDDPFPREIHVVIGWRALLH
jgi:Tol biopolymer transport system component